MSRAELHRPLQRRAWQRRCRPPAARRALCAILATAFRSTMASVGLAGVSRNSIFVFGRHRALPLVDIAAVDQRVGDAEARQDFLDHIAAGAEHRLRARRHDRRLAERQRNVAVTAAMPLAVARATGAPSSAAMRASNIETVGLPKRRVLVAFGLALEAGLRFSGRLIGIAGGQEQRLRLFPEMPCASARRARPACARAIFRAFCSLPWRSASANDVCAACSPPPRECRALPGGQAS